MERVKKEAEFKGLKILDVYKEMETWLAKNSLTYINVELKYPSDPNDPDIFRILVKEI